MSKEFKLYTTHKQYDFEFTPFDKDTAEFNSYYTLDYDKDTELKLKVTSRFYDGFALDFVVYIKTTTYTLDDADLKSPNTVRKYEKTYDSADVKSTDDIIKEIENSINQNNLDFEQLGFTLEGVEIYD